MTILNIYILKKFIKPFIASFAALCILIFVSQLFDRLDRFMNEGVTLSHVIGFLITSLPYQALQMLPVACLLGTLFVVGNLSRSREYIAGLAGGIPPEKFLSGLFMAGIAISFFALVANETVIPPITRYARTVYNEKIKRLGEWRPRLVNNLYVAGADGRIWSAKTFDENTGKMNRVVVDTFNNGLLGPQIDALSAQWSEGHWIFTNGVQRHFHSDGISIQSTKPFDELSFDFREKPSDFVITEPEPEEMTFKNLKRHIERLSSLGIPVRQLQVELMMKLSFPFTCLVVIILGVPLALRSRGSRAFGIAMGGLLSLFYMGFIQFGKALAQRFLAPWAGAWLGNIVFLSLALYLWMKMRKTA